MRAFIIASTCFFIFFIAADAFAQSVNINGVCDKIVKDLNDKVMLAGKRIQVSENNFWELNTLINLPFSKVLGESLAQALSKADAIVTIQEIGETPLKLIGNYAIENDELVLSVRLRMMGESASEDQAVSSQSLDINATRASWFKFRFDRVARTIVRLLEDSASQAYTVGIDKVVFTPGISGQPPLLFGQEFASYFKPALSTSCVFSGSITDTHPGRITGTYTLIQDKDAPEKDTMDVVVNVKESGENLISSTNFSIPLSRIPKTLLTIMADKPTSVCLLYLAGSSKSLESDSDIVSSLMDFVSEALGKYGLQSTVCKPGQNDGIKVEVSLQAREKSKSQGYKLLFGTLKLKVSDNNKTIGSVSKKIKKLFKNDFEGALEKSVEELFSKPRINKDLAKLILGRS